MDKTIFEKLKKLKPKYKKDGFIIVGISGSYARGEETPKSDLDIVYEIDYDTYTKKHNGFEAFTYLNILREKLKNEFNKDIDLINKNYLSETAKKYILRDMTVL